MRRLSNEEIKKNHTNSINLFYILTYLKDNFDLDKFDVYIIDHDNIKLVDENDEVLYFNYDKDTKEVVYSEDIESTKKDIELSI